MFLLKETLFMNEFRFEKKYKNYKKSGDQMNLDKAVFYDGKDLYDHLDKRINGKPEDEASILGMDVDLMVTPPELQILVIPEQILRY